MEQRKRIIRTTKASCPLRYAGNLFLLIFFLIIWMPLGVLLLMKNGRIATERSCFFLHYHGKWGWLFFWGILFFPVAILLLLIKGLDVIEEETLFEEEIIIERF